MSSSEASPLNQAIFDRLSADTPETRRAADAVRCFTRSLMYHRFTGMPKRGFMRRIMPAIPMFPVSELERRGWPYEPSDVYDAGGVPHAPHAYDSGDLFYEVAEERLAKEDYERRLEARQVSRGEWRSKDRLRRQLLRPRIAPRPGPTREEKHRFFYGVMEQIASQIDRLAQGGNPG